uniref:hypothetical protein n=1 Tax=Pseudomonas sp. MD332_8 TaxID=3241257 RepID=UPI0036D2CC0A
YALRQADDALRLVVGEVAGVPDAVGQFPVGTVYARVVERLRAIAEMISEYDLIEAEKDMGQQALAEAKPAS